MAVSRLERTKIYFEYDMNLRDVKKQLKLRTIK